MIRFLPLKKVCKQIIDCPHESPEWLRDGITVIRNFNLVDGQLDLSDKYCVDEKTYEKRIKRAVPSEGDIIFSREAPIGNCAIIPPNTKCCLGQRLVLLRVDLDVCSPEYLLAALQSQYVKQQIDQVSKSGSIVSNFNIGDLKELVIPIVPQQESVSNISATINSKIRTNKEIIIELESLAKSVYDYWFMQFDFPDENGKPYRTSSGEMVWNEQLKREIPKGWNVTRLRDICDFRNGINYDKGVEGNQEYRIINVRNISSSSLLLNETELDKITLPSVQADKYLLSSDDIVIARSGTPGATRLMWKINDPTIFCGFIICSTPHEALHKIYLTYCLKSLEGTSATKTGGSILQNVSQDTLKSLFVLIPDGEVLRQFNAVISPILEKIHSNIEENNELTKLRDWLLPMLMNGQARVE